TSKPVAPEGVWVTINLMLPPPARKAPSASGPERCTRSPLLLRGLRHLDHRLLHLLRRWVELVRRDHPAVTERIFEASHAIAPKLIHERHLHFAADFERAGEEIVAVFDEEKDARGAAV